MHFSFTFGLLLSISMWSIFSVQSSSVEWLGPQIHEFGDLIHTEGAVHEFEFKNISGDTILIDNVRPSCGCTIPEWENVPVLPDSVGSIRVEYDARDQGYFKKKIKVFFSNQRRAEILFVEGWVVKVD
jgi:hypothetical protein